MNETGNIIKCRLPGKFRLQKKQQTNPVVVGDMVAVSKNRDGTGTIDTLLPRKNKITRQATHGKQGEHVIAANVDQALVVVAVRKPRLKTGFIDRFLVTCEAYDVDPVVVINKMDLLKNEKDKQVSHLSNTYHQLGYPVIKTSIYKKPLLKSLKEILKQHISVMIGPSGTGKTSLLNQIDDNLNLPVSNISDYSNKGKHTTTYSRLIELPESGYLVDTPGIREFGLVNFEPEELSRYFPEMLKPRQHCRFYNCTHSHEPDCGVMAAFENGEISSTRYQSYLQMLESLEQQKKTKY